MLAFLMRLAVVVAAGAAPFVVLAEGGHWLSVAGVLVLYAVSYDWVFK